MLFTDLTEIKHLLQIDPDNHNEDWLLMKYAIWTTSIFETLLNRRFTYAVRTQVYKGTGTQKLLLRNRPVYPTAAPTTTPAVVSPTTPFQAIQVIVDENGNFGQQPGAFQGATALPLTFGTDYCLDCNRDDGGCDNGILIRVNNYWPKPMVRQAGLLSPFVGRDTGSVQVTYTAGWTYDSIPGQMQMAADLCIARFSYTFPLGMEVNSESYIDRNISISPSDKSYLLGMCKEYLWPYRNWSWGDT